MGSRLKIKKVIDFPKMPLLLNKNSKAAFYRRKRTRREKVSRWQIHKTFYVKNKIRGCHLCNEYTRDETALNRKDFSLKISIQIVESPKLLPKRIKILLWEKKILLGLLDFHPYQIHDLKRFSEIPDDRIDKLRLVLQVRHGGNDGNRFDDETPPTLDKVIKYKIVTSTKQKKSLSTNFRVS